MKQLLGHQLPDPMLLTPALLIQEDRSSLNLQASGKDLKTALGPSAGLLSQLLGLAPLHRGRQMGCMCESSILRPLEVLSGLLVPKPLMVP